MYLDEAQTIVRARTSCVGISIQSLTAAMAALDLRWMAIGTEYGLQIRIFGVSENGWGSWQLEFASEDHHVAHALTHALAEWFTLRCKD